jgi:hypothetical protein
MKEDLEVSFANGPYQPEPAKKNATPPMGVMVPNHFTLVIANT